MLRLKNSQLTVWDEILPPELRGLSEELGKIDRLLDDEKFMAPFLQRFNSRMGRPTIPVETYLRLMYLKFRYNLGYEVLVREVSDSFQWRRFCRISLNAAVPHSTTLIKLTRRYGAELLEDLNQKLLLKCREEKIIRGRKLRIDTTVMESDIHYPTDAGLLADGVRVLTGITRKLKGFGLATRTGMQARTRSVKRRILEISKALCVRSGQTYDRVKKITGNILKTTEVVVSQAKKVLKNAGQALKRNSKKIKQGAKKLVGKLDEYIVLTEQVIAQTREVQKGNRHIPNRVISIFDREARPICKGKLKSPTEFGRKILLQETEDRIITGYKVLEGNQTDGEVLIGAVEQHVETFGRSPTAVATDRGFSSKDNEEELIRLGVKRISIRQRGKPKAERKAYEKQGWFKRLQKWRAGIEGTISVLKRKYGLERSRLRGTPGCEVWLGLGVFTYNLRRITALQ